MMKIHAPWHSFGLACLTTIIWPGPAWAQSVSGLDNASCNASFKRSCAQSTVTTTQTAASEPVATAPLPDLGNQGVALMLALFAAAILTLGRRTP